MNSCEFVIDITEDNDEKELGMDLQLTKEYTVISQADSAESKGIVQLQALLKAEQLLLEYQQKRKNERVKQIEYAYVNAFNSYLWYRSPVSRSNHSHVILNNKDIVGLSDNLLEELQVFQEALFSLDDASIFSQQDCKPPQAFLIDFMNFFPNWHSLISRVIALEVDKCERVEETFESEYTFPSKVLSYLRHNDKIRRFCVKIFTKPLEELEAIEEELIVDFVMIYEKWSEIIFDNQGLLQDFMKGKFDNKPSEVKRLRAEIEVFYGKLKSDDEASILLEEMNHFSKQKQSIDFLLTEVGEEELVTASLNLRLAWLVWKKVLANRKKLESVATLLVNQIITNHKYFPSEIKYVVNQFKRNCIRKFGYIKFEDLKTFFNKVIFSQLLFSEFMSMHKQGNMNAEENNLNLTMIALVSQKIMFGQQFYEKYKYGTFNGVIHYFVDQIKTFIGQFASTDTMTVPLTKEVQCILVSFETIKYVYESLKLSSKIKKMQAIEQQICGKTHHRVGSSEYSLSSIYTVLVNKLCVDYTAVLHPASKIKKTLIDFLILIDKVPENCSLKVLLQQYRCGEDNGTLCHPSVQLYANYLQLLTTSAEINTLIEQIVGQMMASRQQLQRIKIQLEKEYNYGVNLQKMYMRLLHDKKQQQGQRQVDNCLKELMVVPLGFDYEVLEGKVCQKDRTDKSFKQKTIKKCLHDVAEYFCSRYQGTDGLYHLLLQRVVEEVQKLGVINEEVVTSAKNRICQKLYCILNLQNYMTTKDKQFAYAAHKHNFVTLRMLDLAVYSEEEELLVGEALELLAELNMPNCADKLLRILQEVTLVFQNIVLTTGKASDITADLQIPLMMLVVIRSGINNLVSIVEFIEQFCCEDISSSVLGQTLTLVKSAIFLICTLDAHKLNISEEKYTAYLTDQYVLVTDEHQMITEEQQMMTDEHQTELAKRTYETV